MKRILLLLLTAFILVSCGSNGNISQEESLAHFEAYFASAESVLASCGFEFDRMNDWRAEKPWGTDLDTERSCSYGLTGSNSLDLDFYNENGVEKRSVNLWVDKNEKDVEKWFDLFDAAVASITAESVGKDLRKCFDKLMNGSEHSCTVYPHGFFGRSSLSVCEISSAHSAWWEIKYFDVSR